MLSILKNKLHPFNGLHDIFDSGGSSAPPAPDYGPMAQASKEAAEIMAGLGRDQIAESRRQYDRNMEVADPVIKAQLALMGQQQSQGDDYYKYMQDTYRPLERNMVNQANLEASDARAEEMASQATADMRRGQTQQANMMVRQGLRYGYSPAKMAAMAGQMAGANSSAVAGAATGARNQQRNVGWARQMDAAGLGRNLTGASQGAYGLSMNAGNSAVNNSMQQGNALLAGNAQGAGMIGQGQGMRLQGLGGILNAQSGYANTVAQSNANSGGGMGALMGLAGQLGSAYMMMPAGSDRRLKRDIVLVGKDEPTGLNLYEFTYKDDPEQRRFRGVMADEAEKYMPDAVVYGDDGFARVDYRMLGVDMVEV